jgi:hypothetical protein
MKKIKFILLLTWALFACSLFAAPAEFPPGGRILDAQYHHLGRESITEDWPEVSRKPVGLQVECRFESPANAGDWTLAIRQRDVTERCLLRVNDKEIALLKQNQAPDIFFYAVPSGLLNEGENQLRIVSTRPKDNLVVGPIHLYTQPVHALMRLRPVTLTVHDAATGKPVPARITITDLAGKLVEIFDAESSHTAVRLGTLYTLGTETSLRLRDGEYVFCASHGMEWGRGETKVTIQNPQSEVRVPLTLRREVDTTGFIAADTHIHTLTFSGHGDSNLEERMVTLAGEGVELAIATDHNHNTDYRPYQEKLELNEFFTPVTGNEISSPVGHFNGFPLDPKDPVPPYKLTNWVQLVDGIRAKGAKVVILNHPRGEALARYAFNVHHLNRASGEFDRSTPFPFDAMELTNPSGKYDPVYLLRDWFALLNHGEKVTAVGASDSHTVGDPVGWWRSYVPSATDDPAKIDVDDACNRYLAGETSLALGIFTDIRVDGVYKMGQTFSPQKNRVDVRLRVAAPSWVKPRRALLFLNGQQVAEQAVRENPNGPTDVWLEFSVARPRHDAHLVGAIIGDGVDHPSASSKKGKNTRFTLAVANPVYLDVNGNGRYESPRETARGLLSRAGNELAQQWSAILAADEVIAVQMVSLLRQATAESARPVLDERIRKAAAQSPLMAEYAQYALPILLPADQLEPAGGR